MQKLMMDVAAGVMKEIVKKFNKWCFRERTNGFNIQAKKTIEGKTRNAARYMARYVRHPAIADSRIIGYNTEKVTFIYKREGKTRTVIMDKFEFIHNVIKHIPDENFKMVRYFGIHARRAKRKAREVMEELGKVIKYLIRPFSWRKNVTEYNGKDPLTCDKCGGHMVLCKVTYRDKYGEMREYNRRNHSVNPVREKETMAVLAQP